MISAVGILAGVLSTTVAERTVDTDDHGRLTWTLGTLALLTALATLAFAHTGSFMLALASFWAVAGLRAAQSPLELAWLNRRLPSAQRATILSMQGQSGLQMPSRTVVLR